MIRRSLFVAVSLVLANAAFAVPAATLTARALPFAVHDQVGAIELKQVPDLFRHGVAVAGRQLAAGHASSRAMAGPPSLPSDGDPQVGWVWGDALGDRAVHAQVTDMYRAGMPVLVVRVSADEVVDHDIGSIFGAVVPATIAVYHRGANNGLQSFSIDVPVTASADLSTAVQHVIDDLRHVLLKESMPKALASSTSDVEPVALPRVNLVNTAYASDKSGASVTLTASVVRSSTRSSDTFEIVTKSSYNLIPKHNGLADNKLTIPYRYSLRQDITTNGQGAPTTSPVLTEQFPKSDNRTDIHFDNTLRTTTSYGFNINGELAAGLQGKDPTVSAKTAFGFTFGKEYVDERRVAFSTGDYFVRSAASKTLEDVHAALWDLELAPAIRGNDKYFGKPPTTSKVTPTMVTAAPEVFASWRVDAQYKGAISLTAKSTITNVTYTGSSRGESPDPRFQPVAFLRLEADSPYLTRETAVLIQSQHGGGGCLVDDAGAVLLRECPNTAHPNWTKELHAQWQLDMEGRYFNRGSGNCMTLQTPGNQIDPRSDLVTKPCTLDNTQRWEWRADRIYSLYDGGSKDWRLYVDQGLLRAIVNNYEKYQALPTNPFHPLLAPWASYPSAPLKGDFIPRPDTGNPPSIPAAWESFKAVNSDQVWRIVVLREGLHR